MTGDRDFNKRNSQAPKSSKVGMITTPIRVRGKDTQSSGIALPHSASLPEAAVAVLLNG